MSAGSGNSSFSAPPRQRPFSQIALALHPAVVLAVADDVDLFDVVHADVGGEHRPVGSPTTAGGRCGSRRRRFRRASSDRRRRRICWPSESCSRRGPSSPSVTDGLRGSMRRIARDDRVEPLRLRWVARVRSAAVAESVIAAAGVEQAVVGIAGLRGRVELDRAHRMREVRDDVRRRAAARAACPRTTFAAGLRRVPLGDDVVVGHVLRPRNPGGMKSGVLGLPGAALGVHGVEQAVARELGMEGEADEAALEPVVDGSAETPRRRSA